MEQAYCEIENIDPEIHQKWLAKHGFQPDEQGQFSVDTFAGSLPVTNEQLFQNIAHNTKGGWWAPLLGEVYDERTFVMVCGGPSADKHVEDIRLRAQQPDKYLVVCSNITGKWLLSHNIVPHAHFIIDPQERKAQDVKPWGTNPNTEYWLNLACHPAVFDELRSQGIKPHAFLADFESEGRALTAVKNNLQPGSGSVMAVQGGTMAGLRAMNLADALGFRSMEFFGFDASVEVQGNRARPYAYEKKRGEAIIDVTCDKCGAVYPTTLVLQRQVNEFVAWQARMPWLQVRMYGSGLMQHYKGHLDEREASKPRVAHRYTNAYAQTQLELHSAGNYGTAGASYAPSIFHAIAQLAKRLPSVSVLDYGSSVGNTRKRVDDLFWMPPTVSWHQYDPFVDEFSADPSPADLVLCTDVMEHVEPECTENVLDHLQALTRRMIFMSVSLVPANKILSDGRNAHINLRPMEWWLTQMRKRFILSEATVSKDASVVLIVGQSIPDVREVLRRRKEQS